MNVGPQTLGSGSKAVFCDAFKMFLHSNMALMIFSFFDITTACKKESEKSLSLSLVSGLVLDIPSSHSEAGCDVLESMTSLSLTDVFK